MFSNFFNRTKIEEWEIKFLLLLLDNLGNKFNNFKEHLSMQYIKGVQFDKSTIPNFVSIKYTSEFYKKYEDKKGKYLRVVNILTEDVNSKRQLIVSAYFCYGILLGYALNEKLKKYILDLNKLDISQSKIEYLGESSALEKLKDLLSEIEYNSINSNDIYELKLGNKIIFHLKDLEDGDFIGIDQQNNIYKVTHDPYELNPILRDNLLSILQQEDV